MIPDLLFIPNIHEYIFISEIKAGYSGDRKFKIQKDDDFFLVRVGDNSSADVKRKEYEHLKLFEDTEVNTHRPIDFGIVGDRFYSIVSWVEGTPLMEIIKSDLSQDYYELGRKVGIELKNLHRYSTVDMEVDWHNFLDKKVNQIIRSSEEINMGIIEENAIKYIQNNLDIVKDRPCLLLHGDYHWENLIVNRNGEIGIIDFSDNIIGDPWYEFGDMMWVLEYSKSFANGQLDGYFGVVPDEFWGIFKLYTAIYALEHLTYNDGNDIKERMFNSSRMLGLFGEYFTEKIPYLDKPNKIQT